MKTDIDLKSVWNKQFVPVPNQEELFKKIEDYKVSKVKKTILLNVLLLVTVGFVLFIWVYFKPQLVMTQLGIVLTIISMFLVIFYNIKTKRSLKKTAINQSNIDYLNHLKVIKLHENLMQTKVMSWYFVLLSVGLVFYMYEYSLMMALSLRIILYAVVLLWIGFNWFVLRPKIIKKNKEKLNDLITSLERIIAQFNKNKL
ncbi:MAG TPA: hypothetical protein VLY87_02985 [Flavobacterium sp.]|nr:hypothetical protein [Flavobacterium sp.]